MENNTSTAEKADIPQEKTIAPTLNWFTQRITGVFLAGFLFAHVVVLHFLKNGEINFDRVFQRIHNSPLWFAFYLAFIIMGIYHGLNGVWSVIIDYNPSESARKGLLALLWFFGIAAAIMGLFVLNGLIFTQINPKL
ncbi:MAG: succinate dehydrogenase, hydrophobic membrane anchor protein [Planctomycetes bacterium]|nr:succinate dehydrogenase, hydrophobic membrane anchor protein [Planctomycetota bacterium]